MGFMEYLLLGYQADSWQIFLNLLELKYKVAQKGYDLPLSFSGYNLCMQVKQDASFTTHTYIILGH